MDELFINKRTSSLCMYPRATSLTCQPDPGSVGLDLKILLLWFKTLPTPFVDGLWSLIFVVVGDSPLGYIS